MQGARRRARGRRDPPPCADQASLAMSLRNPIGRPASMLKGIRVARPGPRGAASRGIHGWPAGAAREGAHAASLRSAAVQTWLLR